MPGRLDGRVAVVTGASRGIGRAIALAFAGEGAGVVAGARDVARLDELVRAGDGRVVARRCDVREEADVRDLLRAAADDLGRLDVVCNNAGIYSDAPLCDTSTELWDEIMRTNVRGVFFGCKHAMAAMRAARRGGAIINVASTSGLVGERRSAAYGASKGAVLSLTRHAAAEGAEHGIRVNALCPATADTAISASFVTAAGGRAQADAWVARYQPLTGLLSAEQIAAAAVFLASEDAAAMTGASMVVDGGLLAAWDHGAE